jgi:hypothetical protein
MNHKTYEFASGSLHHEAVEAEACDCSQQQPPMLILYITLTIIPSTYRFPLTPICSSLDIVQLLQIRTCQFIIIQLIFIICIYI